jgi:hypothetical protein
VRNLDFMAAVSKLTLAKEPHLQSVGRCTWLRSPGARRSGKLRPTFYALTIERVRSYGSLAVVELALWAERRDTEEIRLAILLDASFRRYK